MMLRVFRVTRQFAYHHPAVNYWIDLVLLGLLWACFALR